MDAKACYDKCVGIVDSMHTWPPHLIWAQRKNALGPDEALIHPFVEFHSKKQPMAAFPGISDSTKKELWKLLLKNDWATFARSKLYPNTESRTKVCFGLIMTMPSWPAHILDPMKKKGPGTDAEIINNFVDYHSTKNFAAQFPGISDGEKKELKQTLEKFKFGTAFRDQLAAISKGKSVNNTIAKYASGWVSDTIKENIATTLAEEMAAAVMGSAAAGEAAAGVVGAAMACSIQ